MKQFTEQEVNEIIKKRLERAQKNWQKVYEQKLMRLELENQLLRRNIPIEFSQLIYTEDRHLMESQLDYFQSQWEYLIGEAVNERLGKFIQQKIN